MVEKIIRYCKECEHWVWDEAFNDDADMCDECAKQWDEREGKE
jgi:hypothetical protein